MARTLLCGILCALLLVGLALADAPLVEDTGSITLQNDNGQVSAGVSSSNTISVTFASGDSGGVGGGGGGGGAETLEENVCLTSPPSSSHLYDALQAEKEYALQAPNNQFLIRRVGFRVTEAIGQQATFSLTHILQIQCETIPPVAGDLLALGYERIDYIGVLPGQIAPNVTIRFSIPGTRLQELKATPAQVQLLRYDGSNWNGLPVQVTSENDAGYATFTATSPGLSHYAIAIPVPRQQPTGGGEQGKEEREEALTGAVTGGAEQPAGGAGAASGSDESKEARSDGALHNPFPWLSILIILVIGGALGAYYYRDYRQKAAVNAQAASMEPKEQERLLGFASIGDDAFADPVERLKAYVDTELRQGFPREEIATKLRSSGWPESVISSVLDEFRPGYLAQHGMHEPHDDYGKALAFLQEKLRLGYDAAVIRRSLLAVGWSPEVIDSLLRNLADGTVVGEAGSAAAGPAQPGMARLAYSAAALSSLRAFIERETEKGHAKERIREALLKAGWHAETVDEELERDS